MPSRESDVGRREYDQTTMTPPVLTTELLEALERRWHEQDVPLATRLQPGLSEAEIDAATAPLDLRLPIEARRWWGWHDGVPTSAVRTARDRAIVGPGIEFVPLQESVQQCIRRRERSARAAERPGAVAELLWAPHWFPITHTSGPVVCDCSVAEGDPTPILLYEPGSLLEGIHEPRARSFGELVTWWIDALDSGAWRYHADDERWTAEPELLPSAARDSWLV